MGRSVGKVMCVWAGRPCQGFCPLQMKVKKTEVNPGMLWWSIVGAAGSGTDFRASEEEPLL